MNTINFLALLCLFLLFPRFIFTITMKQFDESLDTIRSACAPQFKVTTEQLDKLRKGTFEESKDLKCYTKCVAQMAGTLNKKGEISHAKSSAQIEMLIPDELRTDAKAALDACISTQDKYKNPCEKTFYTSKCVAEFNPEKFKFP